MRELVTAAQLSREWGIPERTLERWRYEGGGPPYLRVGRAVRYDRHVAEGWLDAQQADQRRPA